MFQSLRANSQIYIYRKGNKPFIELGYLVNSPTPRVKFPNQPFIPNQEYVVDLNIKIGEKTELFSNVPANLEVAECYFNNEAVILYTNKDSISADLSVLKQKSIDIINSVPYHEELVKSYDEMLKGLNPEIVQKELQDKEITELKGKVDNLTCSVEQLMAANKELLEQLKNKES